MEFLVIRDPKNVNVAHMSDDEGETPVISDVQINSNALRDVVQCSKELFSHWKRFCEKNAARTIEQTLFVFEQRPQARFFLLVGPRGQMKKRIISSIKPLTSSSRSDSLNESGAPSNSTSVFLTTDCSRVAESKTSAGAKRIGILVRLMKTTARGKEQNGEDD